MTAENLWKYFEKISGIPHCSGNEGRLREFIKKISEKNKLKFSQDATGNLLVFKPAQKTDCKRIIVLQSHLDMVCVKDKNKKFDFKKDKIKLKFGGGYVSADGTSLGADNGIGVAAMLSLMTEKKISHPAIEFLFTVEEETGLRGAAGLRKNFLRGRTFINLDSEEEGAIFVGCAGGVYLRAEIPVERRRIKGNVFDISVSGLAGGHSGIDIDKERDNAVKVLGQLLAALSSKTDFGIVSAEGGSEINVIPVFANAKVLADDDAEFLKTFRSVSEKILKKNSFERKMKIEIKTRSKKRRLSAVSARRISDILNSLPTGVFRKGNPPQSSANLGVLKTGKKSLSVEYLVRGMSEKLTKEASEKIIAIVKSLGGSFYSKTLFPPWSPVEKSSLISAAKRVFETLFRKKPLLKSVHAGLECGVIAKKFDGVEMISIGPDIENAHSVAERVKIKSVESFYAFLVELGLKVSSVV
ncbi:MAG: beta-Ala-His dipeptidase [Elusimicrobia bacterium]|nr:beta-Ala-His dipeptidase [Elusimicrobiota bacterium]